MPGPRTSLPPSGREGRGGGTPWHRSPATAPRGIGSTRSVARHPGSENFKKWGGGKKGQKGKTGTGRSSPPPTAPPSPQGDPRRAAAGSVLWHAAAGGARRRHHGLHPRDRLPAPALPARARCHTPGAGGSQRHGRVPPRHGASSSRRGSRGLPPGLPGGGRAWVPSPVPSRAVAPLDAEALARKRPVPPAAAPAPPRFRPVTASPRGHNPLQRLVSSPSPPPTTAPPGAAPPPGPASRHLTPPLPHAGGPGARSARPTSPRRRSAPRLKQRAG